MQNSIQCDNMNHRRSDVKVRFCPNCGTVVNERVTAKVCSKASHDKDRKCMNKFCVHCGQQIIMDAGRM